MPEPAAAERFPHLLAPGRIGPMATRNRILMAPMGDGLAEPGGAVSPTQAAYYEARARGGAGVVLVGSVAVAHPAGTYSDRQTGASDDAAHLAGLTDLADRVHRHGARLGAQLVHNGALALGDIAAARPLLVPSKPAPLRPDERSLMVTPDELAGLTAPFTAPGAGVSYRIAAEADLHQVVARFAEAADRCRRAGFDAVEVHAGHGYLLDSFLSPAANRRADGWGGSVAGRARLACDVVRAIGAAVGDALAVWVRINAAEVHKDGGEVFADQLEAIDLLVAAGAQAVHVSAYGGTERATAITDSHTPHTVGPLAGWAAAVRERVPVPVITVGRFEPAEAEAVLAGGAADFVAMGRKLLADPDLPRLLATPGGADDARPCTYQYRCIGNIYLNRPVACAVNATTAREASLAAGPSSGRWDDRSVLVVGGGPAGLEAARALALAGARVELCEASDRLGGALALGAAADEPLARYLAWLERRVAALDGVTVRLGTPVSGAGSAEGFDQVLVATGARWVQPAVPGGEAVLRVPDLRGWFDGTAELAPGPLVVVGGGKVGLSLAALARRRGRQVVVVEPSPVLAPELGLPGRFRLVADVEAAGVELLPSTDLVSVADGRVLVSADGVSREVPCGPIVMAGGREPWSPLADELRAAGSPCQIVGDARRVAGLEGCTQDALAVVAP